MIRLQFSAVADATDEDAIEEAHRISHDQLLAVVGVLRRSGVRWIHVAADDPAIDNLLAGVEPEDAVGVYRSFLRRHPRGLLIVAICDVHVPSRN